MLFLDILKVSASEISSFRNLCDSESLVSNIDETYSVNFSIEPTSNRLGISSANITLSSEDSSSIALGGRTYTFSGTDGYNSISLSGSQYSSTGYISLTGSEGSSSISGSGSISPESGSISGSSLSSGQIDFTTNSSGSCTLDFAIPFTYFGSVSSSIIANDYYCYSPATKSPYTVSGVSRSSVSNIYTTFNDSITGFALSRYRHAEYLLGSQIVGYDNNIVCLTPVIHFTVSVDDISSLTDCSFSFGFVTYLHHVKSSFQDSVGNTISDPKNHSLMQESNTVSKDTNNKVTNFFNSFFDNLIGVFVPESDYFSNWFSRLNTMLSDKLGILYAPLEIFINFTSRLSNEVNSGEDSVIHFPAIILPMNNTSYTIFEGADVDLNTFNLNISNADTSNSSLFGLNNLVHVIRWFTDFIFLLSFLSLLRKKLNLILRGVDDDN